MDKVIYTEQEMSLIDPKPGTAAAAARDFGIDLSLTVSNLRLTPGERIKRLDDYVDGIAESRRTLHSIDLKSSGTSRITAIEKQIKLVSQFQISCVLVGGFAAVIRGASITTREIEVCYSRDRANLTKVVAALRSIHALLRGAPKDTPFILDEEALLRGLNFTFETYLGEFDLFGEIEGVGDFTECIRNSEEVKLFGSRHRVLSLDKLIVAKRSAGTPKDLLVLRELEAILHNRRIEKSGV
jgi:hypothetical protein